MNVQDTDLGDLRIDLGNMNQQKGYGGTNESAQPKFEAAPLDHEAQQQRDNPPRPSGIFSCFTVEFYQPYFDVTTDDVKYRILSTIDPRNNEFFERIQGKPDIYGPFWIYTTLIFTLAASANFSNFIIATYNSYTFQSRFDFVPAATGIIYGFGIIVPIVFTFMLRLNGSKVNYIDTLCIYGYSTFIIIPALILSIIPITVLQWIVLMVAMSFSTWFLLNNYSHELKKYVGNQRYILLGIIGGSQVVLFLVFRLKFFGNIYGDAIKT